MRRSTRAIGRLGIYVAATAVVLVALEFASRALRPVVPPTPLVVADRPDWSARSVSDPILFWRLAPSVGSDGEPETNRLGFRGPEVPRKGRDEFRILSLGASVTFAGRLPYEACYSAVLQDRLGELDGKKVRVINTGVPGWSLFQGTTFLRHRGLGLHPDMVVTYFGQNNFSTVSARAWRSGAPSDRQVLTDRELFRAQRRIVPRLLEALKRHSNLVRVVTGAAADSASVLTETEVQRVPVEDQRQLLSELRELCAANDVRLVIVIPWYRYFKLHIPVLRELARDANTLIVDLPAQVEGLERPQDYFLDRDHLNSRGHALVADIIAAEIRAFWPQAPSGPAQ